MNCPKQCECLRHVGANTGPKNGQWKGNNAGYFSIHEWVRNRKTKPKCCERCNTLSAWLDLANISGKYKRELSDYQYICRRCHMTSDGRLTQLVERNRQEKGKPKLRNKKGQYVSTY